MTMENYDELFKKMVTVLFGCVLCWLIGHLFASCTPGRQVTGSSSHRVDTVYAVKTERDTARVSDSVIVRVTSKGDTVYKTKEVWRERERVRWRVDTVYKAAVRTDTIRVPVADFNSIKVRLEHTAHDGTRRRSRFQFHKGTIRTSTKGVSHVALLISIP